MQGNLGAGATAGIVAGLVFGVMMQIMTAPTPDGRAVPMMMMVAQVVKSESIAVGWLYHLFNSAVIGGIFGWLFGTPAAGRAGPAAGWGALYGFAWWVLGGLILMPILLDMPPFAPLTMPPMRRVALGSLMGHLIFGLILGVTLARLRGGAMEREVGGVRPPH